MNAAALDRNIVQEAANVSGGLIKPFWMGDVLLLARRVTVRGEEYIQGCWLDWPQIQQWLKTEIADLLPEARLEPVRSESPADQTRLLAALPVRLIPGQALISVGRPVSPIRVSLVIAWLCVLLAAGAVAILLLGTVSLSERRAAFVSAVTHEMRTPLTTFRIYTEMLTKGMVPNPDKQRRYLNTLRVEAGRLNHLVENVLAYARLERNRTSQRAEPVTVRELIDRVKDRLSERAQQADMELVIEATPATLAQSVQADASAVEQILFNLVDNACKYAAASTQRLIHLEVDRDDRRAILRVRDHGPGISKADSRRLFRPFSKSAQQAANSAPGVGLGLALSRRLARDMGGNLHLNQGHETGACFVLTLPAA